MQNNRTTQFWVYLCEIAVINTLHVQFLHTLLSTNMLHQKQNIYEENGKSLKTGNHLVLQRLGIDSFSNIGAVTLQFEIAQVLIDFTVASIDSSDYH